MNRIINMARHFLGINKAIEKNITTTKIVKEYPNSKIIKSTMYDMLTGETYWEIGDYWSK